MRRAAILLLVAVAGCGEELAEPGDAVLIQGADADAWTAAPVPTEVLVEKVLDSGKRHTLTTAAAPLERFSLGRGGVGRFQVQATDGSGVVRARASSLPLDPAGFAESALPLFIARTERFSRAPGELPTAAGSSPPAAIVAERYVLVAPAAGDQVLTDGYDLGGWAPLGPLFGPVSCPAPPCAFRSLAIVDQALLLGVGDGWAVWWDLGTDASGDAPRPQGLASWADVAGGRTVTAPDGSAFVVGATRADPPSQWVVEIAPTGELFARALATPRAGAAATWVDGRGLVVVGGSASGAGAELLVVGTQAFAPLAYPADATRGAALVALDGARVLRAGGRDANGAFATSVELELGCVTGCAPLDRAEVVELDDAAGFPLGDGEALLVGRDATGATGGVRVGSAGATPTPLREPRSDATAIATPTGHVAVLGGMRPSGEPATSVELFIR